MKQRSQKEAIIDRLLLLYLLFKMRKKSYSVSGDIKLQKLLYKTEERMYNKKYKGLSYNFVRWNYGPFSQEIYVDTKDLEKTGFLRQAYDKSIGISEDGIKLIETLRGNFTKNKLDDFFERVINEFGSLKGEDIKATVYTYPRVGGRITVGQTKKRDILLEKLDDSNASECFWIDDDCIETLSVLFDPQSHESIKKGLRALREEEGKPFTPVLE